ncbi:uncharacterized protein BX663DRAFT_429178 [Cokeromyces recurvatus]|uniref:uncharacterized protein n=1 Tax=Cokeromyces recurvatus TaxID=90255 RepID=UPI00221F10F3|nr:uncharacterized protein BX663DRAFT_429178 [Cokeromyces recurvatus]KAI7905756.1 hypothetical protein BX663DRAFT_429178 [Cokeromyces recurvatus]
MNYIIECERIMNEAIKDQRYTIIIASARFLYSILHIILNFCNTTQDNNKMDLDIPILVHMKELGKRVTEAATLLDIKLIEQDNKQKLRELLKIKAGFCLLLDDWDYDATFKNAYRLLTEADDNIAAILLPYLSTISKRCHQLLSWFPTEALIELKKRIKQPFVFVDLIRLLLRITPSQSDLTHQLIELLYEFGEWDQATGKFVKNGWNLYLMGIEAGICGWYEFMYLIMRDLCKKVETEASFYWLGSLSSLAYAEWSLSQNNYSAQHYIISLNELKVCEI